MRTFWLDLTLPRLNNLFQTEALFSRSILPQSGFVEFSELIRAIIDFRSPFTSAHSAGVATAAECIAGNIGFSGDEINEIRIAGNLHDIGKLALDRNLLLHP
jgi:HD-GYP domain-containing protein (c-di-GMP phosphodiesterase class II)